MGERSDRVDLLSGCSRSTRSLADTAGGVFGRKATAESGASVQPKMTAAEILFGRNRRNVGVLSSACQPAKVPSEELSAKQKSVKMSTAKSTSIAASSFVAPDSYSPTPEAVQPARKVKAGARKAAAAGKAKPVTVSASLRVEKLTEPCPKFGTSTDSDSDHDLSSVGRIKERDISRTRPEITLSQTASSALEPTLANLGGTPASPAVREPFSDLSSSTSFSGLISSSMSRPFHGFSTEELLSANYLVSRELKDRLRRGDGSKPTQEELEFRSMFVSRLHVLPLAGSADKTGHTTPAGARVSEKVSGRESAHEEADDNEDDEGEHGDGEDEVERGNRGSRSSGVTPRKAVESGNHVSRSSGATPSRKRPRDTYNDEHDLFILSCAATVRGTCSQPWVTLAERFNEEFPDYKFPVTNRTIKDRYENLVVQKERTAAASLLKQRTTNLFRALKLANQKSDGSPSDGKA
jgi:hypothetical protein